MGVGKTTVAKLIHKKGTGVAHIGMDRIKKFVSGHQKKAYRNTSKEVLKLMTGKYLKNGISVIIEGTFTASRIEKYRKLAKRRGARYFVYELRAPFPITQFRVKERDIRLKKPRFPKERLHKIYKWHGKNKYTKSIVLDSHKSSAKKIANLILKNTKS